MESPRHARFIAVYSKLSRSREQEITVRGDQVDFAKLRSGRHLGLRDTKHRFNPELPAACERCYHDPDDLVH